MSNKFWLYSGLLILVLALVGVGIWFVLKPVDKVEIPESDPWILMDTSYLEEGTQSQLSIYDDGIVIYWEDTGLPGALTLDPTRTWRTGQLDSDEIDDLSELLDTIGFKNLDKYYLSSAVSTDNTVVIEDNYIKISVGEVNTVTAHGYFTPRTSSQSYPLPDPLEELRTKFINIIEQNTEVTLLEEPTTN